MVTSNTNFLQPSGFKLVIDRKKYGNVEYFAQSVSHPSVAGQAVQVGYPRAAIHMPADTLSFGELQVNVLMDEDMTAYLEIYDWMRRLVNENYETRTFADSDEYPSTADISIVVLTSHNNKSKTIRYIDCVPVDLGSIDFQATSGTTQYITFPVTFSFTRFEFR